MWLQECHSKYSKMVASRSKGGKQPEPKELEIALSTARGNEIGVDQLWLIESGQYWPYPDWWPKFNQEFREHSILVPPQLTSLEEKQKVVKNLLAAIKHIEAVSVVLRFIFPESFGIISPPVLRLLNLFPPEGVRRQENVYVQQYFRYLSTLDKLRDVYQERSGLKKIADYDMALWTAAHLDLNDPLRREMEEDPEFQKIRLTNLLEGLGSHWMGSIRERLQLSRAFLDRDHVVAAVIAARCYEHVIRHVGKLAGQELRIGDPDEKVQEQLKGLAHKAPVVQRKVKLDDLDLWKLRNDAVHGPRRPDGDLREISKYDAALFCKRVEKLWLSFSDILS